MTSKSPVKVIQVALEVARRALPEYSHRFSPKKFTQHQLFAMLVLKSFLKCDYRGVIEHLCDCPSLVAALGLVKIPHYTTLQKASKRLLTRARVSRLLDVTVRKHLQRKRQVEMAAADSSGLECSCASAYFVRRRERVGKPWKKLAYHHYPKLSLVSTVRSHFILEAQAGQGPRPDVDTLRPLLVRALRRARISNLVADAGFDSESNHAFARETCGIRTIIPAKHGRPTDKRPSGRYRRLMHSRFNRRRYRQRAQLETAISMIKRRQGCHVRAVKYWSQCRDLLLKALTHNLMILWTLEVFYRAGQVYLRGAFRSPAAAKG